ncbi:hypothetical protein K5D32_02640 [Pseudomonas cichorii]|uniref:hypothetical protein n=1 Tax=Pseudomonas cichorii TaxID=36746 RepID=UPI001C895FE6|nr:hypothetical protein [Pseudomonas cichorii]MBX8528541.1 hypothetical protein [Pseudomonas cichorii]
MDRCAINFIARHWWRRVEVWLIAILLLAGGAMLGFQVAQWSLSSWYVAQVVEVRRGYDEALKQRDLRINKLAGKAEAAASTATQAADTASKAVDKADEALSRSSQ